MSTRNSARSAGKRKAASQAEVNDDAEVVEVVEEVPRRNGPSSSRGPSRAGRSADGNVSDEDLDAADADFESTADMYERALRKMETDNLKPKDLSQEEVNKLLSAVMRQMLFKRPSSLGPVTREELSKIIGKDYPKKHNLANYIIALAQAKLPAFLGLEMKELEKHKKANPDPKKRLAERDVAAPKMYILRSLLPARMRRQYVELKQDKEANGFALTILALIITNNSNDRLDEDVLWTNLKEVGIFKGKPHHAFGDPETQLLKLVKQRYLTREKVKMSEGGEQFQYEIGEVANANIPRKRINDFIANMMVGAEDEDEAVVDLD
mmetsp:Transcript_30406/g.51225  ORF Transcript_30406/g.51225 Transcript_30406/m.51225 type:complete len:323 (+) Transcript_30406:267-1235(+)|eukprot:CAMPEP_0198212320 /NCGR_PEP_ID=MMETSP1445-20131203/25650_1 /TAXON_ID=36898 /ORGANISM="Pyramimonas sp., Strain CCMP2087" /LENGTH=322 /DNA_ID=CAMNT_0043886739 /DNA_START=254 /DNA_END=1222 /DNA_ORIENTATION=-